MPRAQAVSRFASILDGRMGERQVYDQPLLERREWLAVPTLGAIVPNWLIVIPRAAALNIHEWQEEQDRTISELLEVLGDHLGVSSHDLIWFEHGPQRFHSSVGCGMDYAHLHVIFKPTFTFSDFVRQAVSSSKLIWKKAPADTAYESLPNFGSYLIAGSGDESVSVSQVESVGSQFLRRVVSVVSKQPHLWNYNQFPHMDNIVKTIANFRRLEALAHAGEQTLSK